MSPWALADEPKPAPMPLLLVQAFVNTREDDSDLLLDPSSAGEWLAEAGLWSGPGAPSAADLNRAAAVREGIRALLVANNGGPEPTPGQLEALRDLARASRIRLEIGTDGQVSLESGGRLNLGELLLVIRDAQRQGSWPRLKACHNAECQWAFYDRSHSRRGTWCDMAVCGNRIKNRRLRQRQSADRANVPGSRSEPARPRSA
jgi:predicted RNA-binding Zn ribbon-like protein